MYLPIHVLVYSICHTVDSSYGRIFPISVPTVVGGSGVCRDEETPGTPVEIRGI